jgi:hypothetical protein
MTFTSMAMNNDEGRQMMFLAICKLLGGRI